MIKKITTIFFVLVIIINITNVVYAEDLIYNIWQGASGFLQEAQSDTGEAGIINETNLQNTSTTIYNVLLVFGMAVAVIVSGILGIKFMIGSVEEKSQVKELLVPFVIGCIVIFGAFAIWKIIVTVGNQIAV